MRNKLQKYRMLLIGILLTFSITGCTKNNSDNAETNAASFQKPLFMELVNAEENQSYELEETILENYSDIHYPQLVKNQNVEKEIVQINRFIEEQVKLVLSELGLFDEYKDAEKEDLSPSLSVIYEVKTFNQKFLSVQYDVVYSNIKIPHPITYCFTLNLNLETEQYIYLDDMITINDDFWKEFQLTAKPVNANENEEKWMGVYCPPQTPEGIKELKHCDSMDLTQNTYPIFSYYEASKLYLCFPKDYALGSYGIFEMELASSESISSMSTDELETEVVSTQPDSEKEYPNLTPAEVAVIMNRIKEGDMSYIKSTEFLSTADYEQIYQSGRDELVLCDVNYDGMEELIWKQKSYRDNEFQPIEIIIAYHNNTFECVFDDLVEGTIIYLLGRNENIIRANEFGGIWVEGDYSCISFDADWNEKTIYGLSITYLLDGEEIDWDAWAIDHPYIVGKGIYYEKFESSDEGKLEYQQLTEDEFLKMFTEMTGYKYEFAVNMEDERELPPETDPFETFSIYNLKTEDFFKNKEIILSPEQRKYLYNFMVQHKDTLKELVKKGAQGIRLSIKDINGDGTLEILIEVRENPFRVGKIYVFDLKTGYEKGTVLSSFSELNIGPCELSDGSIHCISWEETIESDTSTEYLMELIFKDDKVQCKPLWCFRWVSSDMGGTANKYLFKEPDIELIIQMRHDGADYDISQMLSYSVSTYEEVESYYNYCSNIVPLETLNWGYLFISDSSKEEIDALEVECIGGMAEQDEELMKLLRSDFAVIDEEK